MAQNAGTVALPQAISSALRHASSALSTCHSAAAGLGVLRTLLSVLQLLQATEGQSAPDLPSPKLVSTSQQQPMPLAALCAPAHIIRAAIFWHEANELVEVLTAGPHACSLAFCSTITPATCIH